LIEMLLVLALVSLVAGLGLPITIDAYRNNNLRSEQDLLVGLLQKARSQSMHNINQKAHGVYVAQSPVRYLLFQGDSYASRDSAEDISFPANPHYELSGLHEVVFSQLSGTSTVVGDIFFSNGVRSSFAIGINSEGQINPR